MSLPQPNQVRKTKKKQTQLSHLHRAFLKLNNEAEIAAFLRDLCTLSELDAMAERFAIAELLAKDLSYRAASDSLGASTTTVTRVAHWFHHGMGGYRTVLSRLKH